jgi:GMP synthase (glutamine-hydrolysing)
VKSLVAIRHVHFEDLGTFAGTFAEAGYDCRYCDAGVDDLSAIDPLKTDMLVVLGAPIGAYEDDKYPFLVDELRILRDRLGARLPTLGICLGAQLIARALGARVYPGTAKEIGWKRLTLTAAGRAGPVKNLEDIPVLHWHGDTFSLPEDAVCLASTPITKHQAFSVGGHALGLQFHPEVGMKGFERWLIGHALEIATAPGVAVETLRRDTARYAPRCGEQGRKLLQDWLPALLA